MARSHHHSHHMHTPHGSTGHEATQPDASDHGAPDAAADPVDAVPVAAVAAIAETGVVSDPANIGPAGPDPAASVPQDAVATSAAPPAAAEESANPAPTEAATSAASVLDEAPVPAAAAAPAPDDEPAVPAGHGTMLGVNIAGGEFGQLGDAYGFGYIYPSHGQIDYYASKGMDVIRVPFDWERLQHEKYGALDGAELSRLDDVVDYAAAKGLHVDLDMHGYGAGFGALVGSAGTPSDAFANVWGQIGGHFAEDGNVMFGLMNEPNAQSATDWLGSVNAAVSAIRNAGAHAQTILVPGTAWDGAWTWTTTDNASVIGGGVIDPDKNVAFEVHQYLDEWSAGTTTQVVSETIGSERLAAVTQWAEQTHSKLFLGEFAAGSDAKGLAALDDMLGYIGQHQDAWLGATYWAGGAWWGDYPFSVEPHDGQDAPQMAVLQHHAELMA